MTSLCVRYFKSPGLNFIKKNYPIRHVSHKGSYEGEGKTTVTILNRHVEYGIMVDSISQSGFTLNIGITILGAMIIFPKTIVSWNISSANEINRDSLALFKVMNPRPDIILLGLDQKYPRDAPFIVDFRKITKEWGMSVEILPIDRACEAFNFLNAENRYIAGAFMPPSAIDRPDVSLLQQRVQQKALMGTNVFGHDISPQSP